MNLSELTPEKIQQYLVLAAAVAGTVGTVGSALASMLPAHWAITQVMARLFADLRNVRAPQLPPLPPTPPKRQG